MYDLQFIASIPTDSPIIPTTKPDMMPTNISTTPTSSSIPLAVCETSGNMRINGALIRHNSGNLTGNFNTVCIHKRRHNEFVGDINITGRNNIICQVGPGDFKLNLIENQFCHQNFPEYFNCDNVGYSACMGCYNDSNFKHCPALEMLFDFRLTSYLEGTCKTSNTNGDFNNHVIKINDKDFYANRSLICYNAGSVVGNANVICRNGGNVNLGPDNYNIICDSKNRSMPKCRLVEQFCKMCDFHLIFRNC